MSMESFLAREKKTLALKSNQVKKLSVPEEPIVVDPTDISKARECVLINGKLLLEQNPNVSKKHIDSFLNVLSAEVDAIDNVDEVFKVIDTKRLFADYSQYCAKLNRTVQKMNEVERDDVEATKTQKPKFQKIVAKKKDPIDTLVDAIFSNSAPTKADIKTNFDNLIGKSQPEGVQKMSTIKYARETWIQTKTKTLSLIHAYSYTNKENKLRYVPVTEVENVNGDTCVKYIGKDGKARYNQVVITPVLDLEYSVLDEKKQPKQIHKYIPVQEACKVMEEVNEFTIGNKDTNQLLSELKDRKSFVSALLIGKYCRVFKEKK